MSDTKASTRFDADTIQKIRALRAETTEDGKPVHTHSQLAAQFDTTAGVISQIVRNKTYVDEAYKPVNDGMRDTGPRTPKTNPADAE